MFIKNFDQLAKTPERQIVLELVETALQSIQPEKIIKEKVKLEGQTLTISDQSFNLSNYKRIFILGFGKGSAKNSKILEDILGEHLSAGYAIDTNAQDFKKIEFTTGTHPLPSQENLDFTQKILQNLSSLKPDDLVLIVTCGGGSVMLAAPHNLTLDQLVEVNKILLHSGANISEMNVIRKHLDMVKGGGLAKQLFPATVVNLIFSDVPGNDLATIASGPTVKDEKTTQDAQEVIQKYEIEKELAFAIGNFVETPKEDKYFQNVNNILILSSDTALEAMQQKAQKQSFKAEILMDSFQSDAKEAGQKLIEKTNPGSILLVGGETTLKVTGSGHGGRNQHLIMCALKSLGQDTVICSFDSDGWDNGPAAGAIADLTTVQTAKEKELDVETYIKNCDSEPFFAKVGDAILTDRLPSNVSDIMIVYKK